MITLPDWCRRARVAAVVAVCAALSLRHGGGLEPLKAAASQVAAAPSNSLEILEVRPSFFVIAGAGANIGVQVGEDGVIAVDAGPAADAPAVLAAIKRISPKPIRYVIDTGPDTVRDLIKAGRSLADVKAAQPAKGYMGRYGNPGGVWTTDRFIEAIYRSLAKEKS
ncbi:MAG: hypothetical protein DMG14_31375 [Acidobacteria bacterium]|nr:MAG: hypothetical protein DMG14_31375 [Acidobacteriota bacterium]